MEQVEDLNKKLRALLGAPVRSRAAPKRKRTESASAKKKIAASQKHDGQTFDERNHQADSVKPAAKAKKKNGSGSESEAVLPS